jgi:hypothetical protein
MSSRGELTLYIAEADGDPNFSSAKKERILWMAFHPFDKDLPYYADEASLPPAKGRFPFRVVYLYLKKDPDEPRVHRTWRYSCRGIHVEKGSKARWLCVYPRAGFMIKGTKHVKKGSIDAAIQWLLEGEQ